MSYVKPLRTSAKYALQAALKTPSATFTRHLKTTWILIGALFLAGSLGQSPAAQAALRAPNTAYSVARNAPAAPAIAPRSIVAAQTQLPATRLVNTAVLTFTGVTGDAAGYASASADVNGDGFDDIIVGAWQADIGATNTGAVYVIFGNPTGYPETITPANLGTRGFAINGTGANAFLGYYVANAGDLNGDGRDEIIIAANGAATNGAASGAAYVIFGKTSIGPISVASLGSAGYRIDGSVGGRVASVANIGDLNGDGINDQVVGQEVADFSGTNTGSVYVVYGKTDTSTIVLGSASFTGYRIDGESLNDGRLGHSVDGIGDVNGDGLPDMLLGAYALDPGGQSVAGAAYVAFGKTSTSTIALDTFASAGQGYAIYGVAAGDRIGISVRGLRADLNGDKRPDLLLGTEQAIGTTSVGPGGAYVLYSKTDGTPLYVNNLGSNGYQITGATNDENLGYFVDALGDVDGDKLPDLLLGGFDSHHNGITSAGAGYVVYGKNVTQTVSLENLTGVGYRFDGVAQNDRVGRSVSHGDMNNDGVNDVILGADQPGKGGSVYVFLSVREQAITFDALANKVYGAAPFNVSASSSSALTVTLASTTPSVCTVSGSSVTIVAAGICTLTADQAGNVSYLAAPQQIRSFTVAPAPLAVTATNATRFVGVPNPTFTASYTGFVNGDTVAVLSGTLVLTTTATTDSPAGKYPIVPGGLTSSNYVISFVAGTLSIEAYTGPTISVASRGVKPVLSGTTLPLHHLHVQLSVPATSINLQQAASTVTYDIQANASGQWALDTATATPTSGALPANGFALGTQVRAEVTDRDAPDATSVASASTTFTVGTPLYLPLVVAR